MQTLNYWKQFESTGKIEDYLSYKSGGHMSSDSVTDGAYDEGQQGARPYAGIYKCNRNHTETGAYRGI